MPDVPRPDRTRSGAPDLVAETPFADTCAGDLRFSTTRQKRRPRRLPKALAECPGPTIEGASATLRVLGASHQVVLQLGDCFWVETLACDPTGQPTQFPTGSVQLIDEWAYACKLELITVAGRDEFAARAAALDAIDHDVRIGVRFAGDPDARTVLGASVRQEADAEVLTWETWHLYPQHCEMVHTVSTAQILARWGEMACQPAQ
ncbi:DUF2617 family protein [Enemella dayhoffiae]|uniref:DUF2617 family protein n=1 Tax=Enemella dayhoffiae TaxID=2016507 RepID=UPI001595DD90|nr:DUF2617 family protein [Enemella dayhoffiae]